ncbi:hypothetical protein MJA45_02570 [Paenibacillus aurantius]|uniref:Uncharacterized protein n=1 Tax=Paenibacillus aurantius TaxID=2918900 RepID=A0AA96LEV7_9BACL|nr:hypothetical protein [Paenibacillus aurantius]WNQ11963.1 hypothetical protein MJA45_02570 [Paenibacillus aurantius]
MTERRHPDEGPEDRLDEDDLDIRRFLQKYEVKYPDAREVDRTVEAVKLHMRLDVSRERGAGRRLLRLLRLAVSEVSIVHPSYWMVSLALYLIGFLVGEGGLPASPAQTLFILSPMPFLLGMAEVFRSRDEGMLELEMSTPFNGASVLLARLSIVGVYTILLNSLAVLWLADSSNFSRLMGITVLWLTPFTLLSGLALLAASRWRGSTAVLVTMTVWVGFCLVAVMSPPLMRSLLSVSAVSSLLLMIAGILLAAGQVRGLIRQASEWEGGYGFEADH